MLSLQGSGDLGAVRASSFVPAGDGTLQLLRPHGVLAAADEVAAVLAAASDDSSTLLIGADAVLDAALIRHGVPRVGADIPTPASAMLLRASIETAFQPADTTDLYDLICADPGPVPRNVAWGLAGVLRKFAGRGSDAWREVLTAQLGVIDVNARDAVAARLAALLDPVASRDGEVEMAAVEARMNSLATWARGRGLDELAARTARLLELLRGTNRVTRRQLLRLCDELECTVVPGSTGEVGLHSVIGPGAMAGPARTVIWWGFSRDRAAMARRVQLSSAERAALGAAAPDFGKMAAYEARRWRRPLELATGTLVLVSPRTDAVGDRAHPHPLWDELVAAMPESTLQASLVVDHLVISGTVRARRQHVSSRPLPQPFGVTYLQAPLGLREVESASSVELLLRCSLAYVLRYHARLRSRLAAAPAQANPLLYGNVAHHVLAVVFSAGSLPPERAAMQAEATLEAELPRIAETVLLPEHQAERSALRRAVIECARLVATVLERCGSSLRGVELPLTGMVGAARVEGRADLVIDAPTHLIDFKWGISSHREALRTGTAVQLAVYAALLRERAGAGFLGIRDLRLLAARGSGIPFASEPGEHSIDEMSAAVQAALEARMGELAEGRTEAPGALEQAPRSRWADGVLRVAPDCKHCELGTLCGRRGRA
jgi:RecB family exonuclease